MKTSKLDDILARTSRWYIGDENTFIAVDDDAYVDRPVKVRNVAERHQQLPLAIKALIDWSYQKQIKAGQHKIFGNDDLMYAAGFLVKATAELLDSGGFKFEVSKEKTHILTAIDAVLFTSDTDDYFLFNGVSVDIQYTTFNDQQIPFVTDDLGVQLAIERDSLEKQYPGWLHRYKMGNDLGIEHSELMRYVFSQDNPENVNISNITFAT